MEQQLRAAWWRDVDRRTGADDALQALLGRWQEPHRHYHTRKHLADMLDVCDDLLARVAVPDPAAVRLAAWFHDAVYDPAAPSGANEEASARLAERVLADLGQPAERVDTVARLVRATATHRPQRDDEAVLCDADLAVLAERPAVYDAYAAGVRAEYAHLDDDTWRTGRRAFLRSLLERPALFHTPPTQAREQLARANLAAELAGLGEALPDDEPVACPGTELWHADWSITCTLGEGCETPRQPHHRHARCSVYAWQQGWPSCPVCGEPPAYSTPR